MKTESQSHSTAAAALRHDPRVAEAKQLLRDALAEHQQALTGVRPAEEGLLEEYRRSLERFGQVRGGNLYYPYLGSGLGRGALVELADGSVKYDMITGIGVHYLGHGRTELLDAAIDGALGDTVMQGNLQQNPESFKLSETFLELATRNGAPLQHCFLTTSGAMANENALKLVFHHHSPADRLLAFEGCFCGRTLALSQVTDKPQYRAGLPRTVEVDYVPFFDAEHPQQSTDRAVEVLNQHLSRYPAQHAGMIFELIQGEGGYYPGDRDFFVTLMQTLRDKGVAIIMDEIQTFGRTTQPFAFQHFGLDAFTDVVTVGKMSQVCATLFGPDRRPPPGLVSQTFTGGTSSIFAAQHVLELLRDGDLFGPNGRIAQVSRRFVEGLSAIEGRHPEWVRGPYGFGAMIALTPFDGSAATAKALLHALYEAGVIAFVAGANPARIRFLPPVPAMEDGDADAVLDILERTLAATAESLEN